MNAYRDSGGGGNQFVDEGSFALAVYAAPLLEAVGIDSGPITGASIDIFNDPEDSATEGWAKRMGLGLGELGAGAALSMVNPLAGAGLMGLGAYGMVPNTMSAVGDGHMLDEWGTGIGGAASAVGGGIADAASWAGNGSAGGAGSVADGASALWDGA